MNSTFTEGDLRITINNVVDARKFDLPGSSGHGLAHCMKAVDFIVELPEDAKGFGLPVLEADPADCQWRAIWRLWAKYNVLNAARVYEGRRASVVVPRNPA